MALTVATWNINGIRARADTLAAFLRKFSPDILCLQETKAPDGEFPPDIAYAAGYNTALHGQKGFNGVAVFSKLPLDEVTPRLPGDETDDHARFLEVVVSVKGGVLRVASLYLPNGNPPDTDKFPYKLGWMRRLHAYAEDRLALEEPLVLAGDYNVIPTRADARFPDNWTRDALFQPETRRTFEALRNLGLTDAVRACHGGPGPYTFWDYQAGAWQKDNGIRIDHALLSPQAADRLISVAVPREVRGWEKPSDHVPVIVTLDLDAP